jgi:uncharacterized protein (TIGR02757 family)
VTPRQVAALARALEDVQKSCNVQDRLTVDPVGVVRRYDHPETCELVGLLAASLAFGNVKAFRPAIEQVLRRLGPELPRVLEDRSATLRRLAGFQYRMVHGKDIGRLLVGARRVQILHGSLGDAFAEDLSDHASLRAALVAWTGRVRQHAGFGGRSDAGRRGPQHVMSDPSGASGCKRLMLYLRWMVRRDDGVDLGLWERVSPAVLLMPVDTHVHRIARNLGLTSRRGPNWLASEEITAILRRIDPADPVRFDFALCHLGMTGGCPAKPNARTCAGCVARGVCNPTSPSVRHGLSTGPRRTA